jgi:hypothetical protein
MLFFWYIASVSGHLTGLPMIQDAYIWFRVAGFTAEEECQVLFFGFVLTDLPATPASLSVASNHSLTARCLVPSGLFNPKRYIG